MNRRYTFLSLISLIIAGVFSLFASSFPDGLEKVAGEKGFIIKALEYPLDAVMPNYSFSGVNNEYLATALAGITGTTIIFLLVFFGKSCIAIW